jgi:transcriptional regulator of acetoin/glycerol metabolism/AraC-like DNA-binding protein
MASSARSANLIGLSAHRAELVHRVARGQAVEPRIDEVSPSWQRSANQHRIDPDSSERPRILSSREVSELREPLDELVHSAQEELDRLYKVVREAGYTILFCDNAGVAIEHRGDDGDATRFRYWGTWLGGVWSEAVEGTNGIGTCIAEERPVTIHRSQHYRTRHVDLSCSGAPVFGADGRLLAVLDISAIDPDRSERAHALTGALTIASARAIEERFFRRQFRRHWVVAIAAPEEGAAIMLLAVDSDQLIVGATRAARAALLLDDEKLRAGLSLWSIFEQDRALFRRNESTDIAIRLVIAGTDDAWPALLTQPERNSSTWQDTASLGVHTRPRADILASLPAPAPVQSAMARGGLPPAAMRRVHEYIEAHLSDSIELAEFAAIAGLSVFHFARAFKQSAGVTPHYYLVRRRVERARELLAGTDHSLSEIAFATGFSDQSHLSRHFRQMTGTSPGQFRRSLR